jgi:hypothetical protein
LDPEGVSAMEICTHDIKDNKGAPLLKPFSRKTGSHGGKKNKGRFKG